ncbi:hypothetical protein HDV00_012074 [Rhizophlyctis rosea]|nr:hypothetical protein HDV00_012074 [Rhizophlyctis rosea]
MSSIPTTTLSNGKTIPVLAFGTGTRWYKGPNADGPLDQALITSIEHALEAGFTHIDGAETYGTEREIGAAIQNYLSKSSTPRSTLFITTKAYQSLPDPYTGLQNSLKRLNLTYVDLYLVHAPFFDRSKTSLTTVWRALERAVDDGLTHSIGVSNFRKEDLEELYAIEGGLKYEPVVNQIEYHPYLLSTSTIQHLTPYQTTHNVKIESYSPLLPLTKASGGPLDSVVEEIAKAKGKTTAQILLKWNLQQGNVVVTSSDKVERLREYVDATAGWELSEEEVGRIESAGREKKVRQYWGKEFGDV